MTPTTATHESRMLIDGKLVDSGTGRQFDNINPATEEVLGGTADGTRADMERAVAAARHAFDHTDWSRNGERRAAGLRQLQAALEAEREDIRSELVAEVGCPVLSTYGPQLDVPLNEALTWPAEMPVCVRTCFAAWNAFWKTRLRMPPAVPLDWAAA